MRQLINWTGIFGFVIGIPAGLYAHTFRPTTNDPGIVATGLNNVLEPLGILLPGLDIFHREPLETGRFAYAAYLGSFFVLVVALWLPSFFLFYRTMANMPSAEFAKVAEGSPGIRKPPYGTTHRVGAWLRLILGAVVLVAGLLLFGRVLPMDAVQLRSGTYFTLGIAGTAVNIFIYILHNYRRFLSTLQPDGFLPLREGLPHERF